MSYGTILYPKLEDFPVVDGENTIDAEIRFMANKFGVFRALSVCTPKDVYPNDALEKITSIVNDTFEEYINSYNYMSDVSDSLDLQEQMSRIKEGETYDDGSLKRPYLYYNHFVYHSKEEAISLITENTTELLKIKARILGLCLATPADITPRDDDRYSDGHYEPLYYIEKEMDYLEEALDECLRAIRVAKLTSIYWDGHEEG